MSNLKVIRKTLVSGTASGYSFAETGSKFLVKNFSDNDCYVAVSSNEVNTKSVCVPSKKAFILLSNEFKPDGIDTLYILGEGEVEVRMLLTYVRIGDKKQTLLSGASYFMDITNESEGGATVGYTLTIKPTSYSPAQEQDMSKGYVLVLGTYNGAYGWHKIQLPNSKQFNDIIINNVSLFSCVFTNPEEYPCAHFNTTGAGTMSLIDCDGTMYNSDDWPNGFYFINADGTNNRKLFYLIQDISISMYND